MRRSAKASQPHTLLLGSYGRGNLGDDVFLEAAVELFRHHTLYVNSADDELLPLSARNVITTISTTSPRDLLRKLQVFLRVRNIIYWGGDLWVELYGEHWPKQLLYKMVALNTLARLWGKKIHYVGCGIGRLEGYSLWLAKMSARLSHQVIVRERRSAEVLGLAAAEVLPDLAINLPYYRPRPHAVSSQKKPFTIGISLLYYLPAPEQNFPKLVKHLAQFIEELPAERFRVVLLPMHVSDSLERDDLWASQQLLSVLGKDHQTKIYQAKNLQDMIQKFGTLDLMIGVRLHANILATFNATPCLGIAYRTKVSSFFQDNGLEQYCVELDSLGKLSERFWDIYDHYDEVAQIFYQASQTNLAKRSVYQKFASQYE